MDFRITETPRKELGNQANACGFDPSGGMLLGSWPTAFRGKSKARRALHYSAMNEQPEDTETSTFFCPMA